MTSSYSVSRIFSYTVFYNSSEYSFSSNKISE